MQKKLKQLFAFSLLITNIVHPITTSGGTTYGKTFFAQRAQEWNLARNWSGVTQFIAPCDIDCLNGFITITPAYSSSFNRGSIGSFFFYNGTNNMTFGNEINLNPSTNVYGVNMFLNNDFNGQAYILPRVENFLVDLRFRLNLDEWICGLYFDIHAPINWTRWNMHLNDSQRTTSGTNIAQYTFGNSTAQPSPVNTIKQAYNGQLLNQATFPNLKQPLQFGRINGKQTKTSLADVTAAMGYNFICNDCAHLGFDVRAIFPTGTRPDADYMFEPIVGNGKHFELGAGLNGHYQFWDNGCDSSFSFWFEGVVYHMFKARQRRIFDLKSFDGTAFTGPQNVGSHSMLIKKFSGGTLTEILYGPNVLARNVKVKNDIHSEVVALFDYQRCGFTFDCGYNFWVRTQDKLSHLEPLDASTYGLMGLTLGEGDATANQTDSTATVNGSGNAGGDLNGSGGRTIIYLTTDSISLESATHPTAMSHKIFAHVEYAWDSYDYTPFLGIGGSGEFSGNNNNALEQWELWVKGGFAFM